MLFFIQESSKKVQESSKKAQESFNHIVYLYLQLSCMAAIPLISVGILIRVISCFLKTFLLLSCLLPPPYNNGGSIKDGISCFLG